MDAVKLWHWGVCRFRQDGQRHVVFSVDADVFSLIGCSRCIIPSFSLWVRIEVLSPGPRGDRVVQWCWEIFQCWGVLLNSIIVGLGPTALAAGAWEGGGIWTFFSLTCHFSFLSPSLSE